MEIEREIISTVFVVDRGRVLLTWNRTVKAWVPLGGHIKEGELPCRAAIREAREESGLDISLVDPYMLSFADIAQPLGVHLDKVRPDHEHINLIYLGEVKGGSFMEVSDEGTPNRFFTGEELMEEDLLPNIRELASLALEKAGRIYGHKG